MDSGDSDRSDLDTAEVPRWAQLLPPLEGSEEEPHDPASSDYPSPSEGPTPNINVVDDGDDDDDDEEDDEDEQDGEEEEEEESFSLFDNFSSCNVNLVWEHMRVNYGFSLDKFRSLTEKYGDYGPILLINYLRTQQSRHKNMRDIVAAISASSAFWTDPQFLKPALANDRLLWEASMLSEDDCDGPSGDTLSDDEGNAFSDRLETPKAALPSKKIVSNIFPPVVSEKSLVDENRLLREQIEILTDKIRVDGLSTKQPPQGVKGRGSRPLMIGGVRDLQAHDLDDRYFENYSFLDIHREMIRDTRRTSAYQQFIRSNPHLFAGKVVLDVGCGSGILSVFCAQAGAALVVGVDAAEPTIEIARKVVKQNKLEGRIELITGKIEEMQLFIHNDMDCNKNKIPGEAMLPRVLAVPQGQPPPPLSVYSPLKCDILVSEWMGYCLLYEAMLYSVLFARERYLRPKGIIIPKYATLQLSAADYSPLISWTIDPWRRPLYNVDLSPLAPREHDFLKLPVVDEVPSRWLRSDVYQLGRLDLSTLTVDALQTLRLPFSLPLFATLPSASAPSPVSKILYGKDLLTEYPQTEGNLVATSLVISFECIFEGPGERTQTVVLSTSPGLPVTHWAQTVFHLRGEDGCHMQIPCKTKEGGASTTLDGFVSISPHKEDPRHLGVAFEVQFLNIDKKSMINYYELR